MTTNFNIGIEDFPENSYIKLNKRSLQECETIFKKNVENLAISYDDIYNWFRYKKAIPLSLTKQSFSKQWIEKNLKGIKDKGNKSLFISPSFSTSISSFEFGEFIGHILGDGSFSSNGRICYTNSEKALLDRFKKLSTKLFGVNYFYERPCTGATEVFIPSIIGKMLRNKLGHIKVDYSNLCIPPMIVKDEGALKGLLRALYDDDGNVNLNKRGGGPQIRISLKSREMILQVKQALSQLDIKSGKVLTNNKGSFLGIYGYKNAKKFEEKIGFIHPRKKKLLRKGLERGGN